MNIEKSMAKQTIKYSFDKNDKIEIKSCNGITKIFINDKPINFIVDMKFKHRLNELPYLEIEKIVTLDEIEETLGI